MKNAVRGLSRRGLLRKRHLRWWLVWGPVRSGTTLMHRLVSGHARIQVGDWGLRHIMIPPPDLPYVHFDLERYRRDVSRNIISNAEAGGGSTLDLAFKQANLREDELRGLTWMWGPPERVIFCFREPSGYIASAKKKFEDRPFERVQGAFYVRTLDDHSKIGGDAFEYHDGLTMADYDRFLAPLGLPEGSGEEFRYTGEQHPEDCTPDMWSAYERLKARLDEDGSD